MSIKQIKIKILTEVLSLIGLVVLGGFLFAPQSALASCSGWCSGRPQSQQPYSETGGRCYYSIRDTSGDSSCASGPGGVCWTSTAEYCSVPPNSCTASGCATGSCTPSWSCTSWGSCGADGTQSRSCTDTNNCGTTTGEPYLWQSCSVCSPTDANWSGWTDTSSCTVTCGGGTKTQSRTCNGTASCGGSNNCTGSSTQTVSCNTQACAVNGSCGTNATTYSSSSTSYSGTFCSAGTASPTNPSFPAVGSSTTWSCNGSGGGTNASCTATRSAAPVNGACGTNATSYLATDTAYSGTFCSAGTVSPSSPAFPAQGSSVSWTCNGANSGTNASCGADRGLAAPVVSVSPTLVAAGGSVTFSWPASANATYYYRAYQRDGVWDSPMSNIGNVTSQSFTTTGITSSVGIGLLACNANGCSDPSNVPSASIAAPTNVDFTATPTDGQVPLTVAFTSSNSGGPITSYSWNFGDGPPAGSGANPSRTYTAVGTYSVTVLASGVGGNSTKSRTNYITVNPAPPVDAVVSVDPTTFGPGADVTFSWNAPANATYYYIAYRRDGAWGAAINIGNVTSIAASTSGLTSSLAAGVYACNVSGCSPNGSNVAVATLAPVPTANIKANNSNGNVNISYNTAASLTWTSSNASSCSVSPGNWTGTSNSSGQSTGNLRTTTTYTLTCTGLGGTGTDSITVNVPAPTVSVDSFTAANPAGGTAPVAGVDFTTTVSGTGIGNIEYQIDCTNNGSYEVDVTTASNPYTAVDACDYSTGGNYTAKVVATRDLTAANRTAAISIGYPAATADIKANNSDGPVYLNMNTQYSLSWSSTNATACTASGDWSGNQSLQGSITFTLISTAKTYTITCTGLGATATDSVTVSPIPAAAANLRITSATPYIKGNTISFAWDAATAATYYMVGYYLNGAWDFNWVAPSPQSATTITYGASTASLNSLGAVVLACKSPAICSAPTGLVTATLLDPTPANITTSGTVTSSSSFNVSLSGSTDVKYVRIDPAATDLLYRVRITQGSPNPSATVQVVDGNGTVINDTTLVRPPDPLPAPVGTDVIFKVPTTTGGEKYLKFQGTRAGNFTYTLKRVRLFPYLEAQ